MTAQHGTPAGAAWHRRRGEQPCDECRHGEAAGARARYDARKSEQAERMAAVMPEPPADTEKVDLIAELEWNQRVTAAALEECDEDSVASLLRHHRWVTHELEKARRNQR